MNKTNLPRFIFCVLCVCFSLKSIATDAIKVNPIFIGYSFSKYAPYQFQEDEELCADTAKITLDANPDFQNESEFMSIFYSKLPHYQGCQWQIKNRKAKIDDFITSKYDLSKIKNTLYAEASCFTDDTREFKSFNLEAHPVYLCPENSVFSHEGCVSIDREHCSGDIVARDLNAALSFVKNQGHVGLVLRMNANEDEDEDEDNDDTGDEYIAVGEKLPIFVLEVLWNKNVINLNKLDDFIYKVPNGYWGEKYGTKSSKSLKIDDIIGISEALSDLLERIRDGASIEYNTTWAVSTGEIEYYYQYDGTHHKFVQTQYRSSIGFRCDTFLEYLFAKGSGIKFDTGLYITPRKLYLSLLYVRNGHDALNAVSPSPYKIAGKNSELESDITEAFSDIKKSELIDYLTYTYIKSSQLENDAKIKFLISLMKVHLNNEHKIAYILDLLMELKPLSFWTDLTSIYYQTENSMLKSKIHKLLLTTILFKTEEETEKLTAQDISNIIDIQHFLQQNIPEKKLYANPNITKYINLISKYQIMLKRNKFGWRKGAHSRSWKIAN